MTVTDVVPRRAVATVPSRVELRMSRRTFLLVAVSLAALAGVVAVVVSLWVFPYHSQNNDEGVYLTQASALRAGDLVPDAPEDTPRLFQPWFSVLRDGEYVYKGSPIHAGVLAAVPVVLGGTRAALALIAAAAVLMVIALARELGASRRAALCAGAFFVLSPLVVIQSATFLPYVDGLVFLLASSFALLRGARIGSRGWLLGGGLIAGVAFAARPFDTMLFLVPVFAWICVGAVRRTTRASLAQIAVWSGVAMLPGLAVFLGYNALSTGSAFRVPFGLLEPADKLGFGNRRAAPYDDYLPFGPRYAAVATRDNLLLLLEWSFGSALLVLLAVYGALSRPILRTRVLLAAWVVIWGVGFFFFWGSYSYIRLWGGGKYLGPYYYLPMLVPVVVAGGVGFMRLLGRSRALAIGFVVVAVAGAGVVVGANISSNLARTRHRTAVADAVFSRTADRESLVFIPPAWGPFLQHPFPFLRNDPGYDGDVVYALEDSNLPLTVARRYPDRMVFAMSIPTRYHDGVVKERSLIWVDREQIVRGRSVDLGVDGGRPGDVLRVSSGSARLELPFAEDGSARFALASTSDGSLVLADSEQEVRAEPGAQGNRVKVSILRSHADGRMREVQRRRIPVVSSADRVEVMWPGVVVQSRVSPDKPYEWSARTIQR